MLQAYLCMHTADCETAFTQMDWIKSDIKNCLTTENLNNLLIINIYEPTCNEFNFELAYKFWCLAKAKRIVE